MVTFEIFWSDLTPEAQERFRSETGTNDPEKKNNWDIFPMTILCIEEA
jgi:hypothetical protein